MKIKEQKQRERKTKFKRMEHLFSLVCQILLFMECWSWPVVSDVCLFLFVFCFCATRAALLSRRLQGMFPKMVTRPAGASAEPLLAYHPFGSATSWDCHYQFKTSRAQSYLFTNVKFLYEPVVEIFAIRAAALWCTAETFHVAAVVDWSATFAAATTATSTAARSAAAARSSVSTRHFAALSSFYSMDGQYYNVQQWIHVYNNNNNNKKIYTTNWWPFNFTNPIEKEKKKSVT